jgi:hypothetical protein
MKKPPEDELWTEILKLWPSAMEYEYLPISFPESA